MDASAEPAVVVTEPRRTPVGAQQALATVRSSSGRPKALTVLAVVAVGYAAHAGRAIVVPAVIAIVLNTLLSPAIRTLARARIAPAFGAAILVLGLVVAVGGTGFAVAEPTAQWVAKAPAALDSAATRIRSNLVTPIVLSRRLTLHPVAIVAGLTFWWGMWGVPGAFLSVPLLATIHVLGEQVPALSRLGNFIGARERGRRGR